MKKPPPVIVKQDDADPQPIEVIAGAIKAIADGMRAMRSTRLNDRALVLLVQDAAPAYGARHNKKKVSASEVRSVLAGIEALEREYLKPKSPPK